MTQTNIDIYFNEIRYHRTQPGTDFQNNGEMITIGVLS